MERKIMYLDGIYKCEIVKEFPNGDFQYKPLEGCSDEELGKVFSSNKSVYFLTREVVSNK